MRILFWRIPIYRNTPQQRPDTAFLGYSRKLQIGWEPVIFNRPDSLFHLQ